MPENIGHMGWGEPGDSVPERLHREEIAKHDFMATLPDRKIYYEQLPPAREEGPMEERLRSMMDFDEGWDFEVGDKLLYGRQLKMTQNIGNCVGASHCQLLASRIALEILLEGDPEEPLQAHVVPYIPYSYGVGRVFIGGGRISGDGSLCEWQIRGTMEYGFLPCSTAGLEGPMPQSTASVGRLFGRSSNVLNKYVQQAKQFDLVNSVDVRNGDQAWDLLVNHKQPLQICSGWGFAFSHYDPVYDLNVYKRSGSWAHSMQIVAAFARKTGGLRWCRVRNQWGDSHRDGTSFVIPWDLFERWITQANVASIGEVKGLPSETDFPVA